MIFLGKKMHLCWDNEYKLVIEKLHPVLQVHVWPWFWHWGRKQRKPKHLKNKELLCPYFSRSSSWALWSYMFFITYSSDSLLKTHPCILPAVKPICCTSSHCAPPVLPMDLYLQHLPALGVFIPFQQGCRALRSDKATAFRCGKCCFR